MPLSHLSLLGRRVVVPAALATVVMMGLAACGSSSSTSTSGASTSSNARFQARLNLAKCYRAHGINVPDPTANGGAPEGFTLRSLNNYPQAQRQAAQQACQQYIAQAFPQANLSPAQRAQRLQQLTQFTQCMRSHGINIPDPTATSGGGFGFGIGRDFRSVDRNSPAFQTAFTACRSLVPRLGRGGPGGGGPGGAPGA
jgi:hypothetical protein